MRNRRDFIRQLAAVGALSAAPSVLASSKMLSSVAGTSVESASKRVKGGVGDEMIWANLLHLSYNMWEDNTRLKYRDENYKCSSCQEAREWAHSYRPFLTFDDEVWNLLLNDMAAVGMNMVVIDLGDGVKYESHPEIAVKNAWSIEKLRGELAKMRAMGLEPIPKLNFASTHDIWLGEYSRMLSTKKYYEVCANLIGEVIEIFDQPRFFHLGMDEETAPYQRNFDYMVIRQNDLWWGDLYFYLGEVEKRGVRPWIWSDYGWDKPEQFFRKMPKSVLQSNWYYGDAFDPNNMKDPAKKYLQFYDALEEHGYDQVPTGSNHSNNLNMEGSVDYCKKVIDSSRLQGFMTAPWRPTLEPCLDRHREAIAQIGRAIKRF